MCCASAHKHVGVSESQVRGFGITISGFQSRAKMRGNTQAHDQTGLLGQIRHGMTAVTI